ncbi:MAG: GumC family protein, partial [Planctomycetaceae bacterium]
LKVLPEKYRRIDLAEVPQSFWPTEVRSRLHVSAAFNTNVLDISYRSPDPRAAAAMLTAMLAGYEQFLNETNRSLSEQGLQTLAMRLQEVNQQIEVLTGQRLELKASAPDLVDTGDRNNGLNVISKNIELLTADYSNARRATEQARNTASELQRAISQNEDILQFASEAFDAAGRLLIEQSMGLGTQDSFHLQRIMQEILGLQSQLTEFRQKYGDRHPRIRALQSELAVKEGYLRQFPAEQQAKTEQLSRNVLAPRLLQYASQQLLKYQQNERSILERLSEEQKKAQTISQILTQISDLDRRIEQLYAQQSTLQTQSDDIGLNKDTFLSTKVASRPTVPVRPVSPKLTIVALLSLVLGTTGGLAVIWVLDIMDDRFRTPEELKLHLDTQVLSMIPRMTELTAEGFEAVMCHVKPHSREVEAFRALRTSIEFSP